ncbi:MAG: prolyl oligopeptidase family serine peptidase, partial [Ilumatobacteraceae bacterium]
LISARFSSNNPAFYDILLGGHPGGSAIQRYLDRSPVLHAHPNVAPTLILHGDADRCTPVGQGEELYRALIDHGVVTEFVTYPGAGHGLRSCEGDVWNRTVAWFDRHLLAAGVDR